MARPVKEGLSYFPFDVGFFMDKKLRLLRGDHGAEGIEIYLRLVAKCFEDKGYYTFWDSDEDVSLMADETGYSREKILLIVSTLLRRSLFNDTLFKSGNVLSSRGIQRRYFSAIRDTKIKAAIQGRYTMLKESYNLLTNDDISEINKTVAWLRVCPEDDYSEINGSKSENNYSKSTINPIKEMKENNTIQNDIILDDINHIYAIKEFDKAIEIIKDKTTENSFNLWIKPIYVISVKDNKIVLGVENQTHAKLLIKKFMQILKEAFKESLGIDYIFEIRVIPMLDTICKEE